MMITSCVTLLLISVIVGFGSCKEVVCYVPTSFDFLAKIDTTLCSVFVIAFGKLHPNGSVELPENILTYSKLKTLTSQLVLAIGGSATEADTFRTVSENEATRIIFAQNCLNLVRNHRLDGIAIDWQFPVSTDKSNFLTLHQDLKVMLGTNYQLSSVVSGRQQLVKASDVYDLAGLAKTVDRIHLLAYDLHSDDISDSSSGVNFNAPLKASIGDSVDQAINFFLQGGTPPSKLILGIPFFGRQYQLMNSTENAPRSSFVSGHQTVDKAYTPAYNQYCLRLSDPTWTRSFNWQASSPYMYSGNMWLSYEDVNSVAAKAKLAQQYNLGGVMVWALNFDDYDGICSACKWILLKAANGAIGRSSACENGTTKTTNGTTRNKPTTPTTPTTRTSTNNTQSGEVSTICTKVGVFISNPADCTKYYQCTPDLMPLLMSCAPGTFWNKAGYCGWTCNS